LELHHAATADTVAGTPACLASSTSPTYLRERGRERDRERQREREGERGRERERENVLRQPL